MNFDAKHIAVRIDSYITGTQGTGGIICFLAIATATCGKTIAV